MTSSQFRYTSQFQHNARSWKVASLVLGLCGISLVGACKKDKSSTLERLSAKKMTFSTCPPKGSTAQKIDLNRDKVADAKHGLQGGKRVCSAYDLDFDGRADVVRFYESDGKTPKREEHDFDFDGRIDQVSLYRGGTLQRKDLDTNFDGRMDARIWCSRGKVTKAMRDRANDGYADTWEVYKGGQVARIRYDVNGDGVPELAEVFDKGLLRELRYDDDGDGKYERKTKIPARDAGEKEEPVACEVPRSEQNNNQGRSYDTGGGNENKGLSPDLNTGPAPGSEGESGSKEDSSSEGESASEGNTDGSEGTDSGSPTDSGGTEANSDSNKGTEATDTEAAEDENK